MIFNFNNILYFIYPLIYWWTIRLFLLLSYYMNIAVLILLQVYKFLCGHTDNFNCLEYPQDIPKSGISWVIWYLAVWGIVHRLFLVVQVSTLFLFLMILTVLKSQVFVEWPSPGIFLLLFSLLDWDNVCGRNHKGKVTFSSHPVKVIYNQADLSLWW